MSFGDAIKTFFAKYANFKGRARRSEFWYSYLFVTLVSMVLSLLGGTSVDGSMSIFSLIYSLWILGTALPLFAVIWRRLHDVNLSGGYFFMTLIPIVGAILVIVKWATEGTAGPNRFGNPVK